MLAGDFLISFSFVICNFYFRISFEEIFIGIHLGPTGCNRKAMNTLLKNVGFCIDTGHEMCYNFSRDLIGKYGEYLIATHLNDNMGITNPPEITFLDDAHLLPFDGIADWNGIADRLNKCGYDGILTFELNAKGRIGDCPNRIYDSLSFEQYVNLAFERAVRFRDIFVKK